MRAAFFTRPTLGLTFLCLSSLASFANDKLPDSPVTPATPPATAAAAAPAVNVPSPLASGVIPEIRNAAEENAQVDPSGEDKLSTKMKAIIVPRCSFENSSMLEVMNYLRGKSAEIGRGKRINIVVDPAASNSAVERLDLHDVSLGQIVGIVCEMTNTVALIRDEIVYITPKPAGQASAGNTEAQKDKLQTSIRDLEGELAKIKAQSATDYRIPIIQETLVELQRDFYRLKYDLKPKPGKQNGGDAVILSVLTEQSKAEAELAKLLDSGLGDQHPRVVALEKLIKSLREKTK